MARNDSFLVNSSAYGALRLLGTVMQSFNVNEVMNFVGMIGDRWFEADRRRRQRAGDNIRRCFPEMSVEAARELCRCSMRHLLQTFAVEVIFTPRLITPTTWQKYVRLGNIRQALQILMEDKPAMFLCGHCGNFELLGFTLATVGFPLYALARPLDLPRIDRWVLGVRERRGMTVLTKYGAMDQVPDLIENKHARIAFVADQNAGDKGLFVPFFGRLASAYKSIGLLAIRYRVPLVCGMARRLRPNCFDYELNIADIIQPEEWVDQPDPLFYLTARYSRAIENMVCQAPEQYFWVHRRWKSRPRHERENQPFPNALRARLEALPWMTQVELDRILANSEADSREIALAR